MKFSIEDVDDFEIKGKKNTDDTYCVTITDNRTWKNVSMVIPKAMVSIEPLCSEEDRR